MPDRLAELTDRYAIGEVVTKLLVYTDQARWEQLVTEVFTPEVHFDGGFGDPPETVPAQKIADGWRIDRFVHHLKVVDGNADLT